MNITSTSLFFPETLLMDGSCDDLTDLIILEKPIATESAYQLFQQAYAPSNERAMSLVETQGHDLQIQPDPLSAPPSRSLRSRGTQSNMNLLSAQQFDELEPPIFPDIVDAGLKTCLKEMRSQKLNTINSTLPTKKSDSCNEPIIEVLWSISQEDRPLVYSCYKIWQEINHLYTKEFGFLRNLVASNSPNQGGVHATTEDKLISAFFFNGELNPDSLHEVITDKSRNTSRINIVTAWHHILNLWHNGYTLTTDHGDIEFAINKGRCFTADQLEKQLQGPALESFSKAKKLFLEKQNLTNTVTTPQKREQSPPKNQLRGIAETLATELGHSNDENSLTPLLEVVEIATTRIREVTSPSTSDEPLPKKFKEMTEASEEITLLNGKQQSNLTREEQEHYLSLIKWHVTEGSGIDEPNWNWLCRCNSDDTLKNRVQDLWESHLLDLYNLEPNKKTKWQSDLMQLFMLERSYKTPQEKIDWKWIANWIYPSESIDSAIKKCKQQWQKALMEGH